MKKVVVLLVCAVVLLVGYIVLDRSGIELPSFGAKNDYEQGIAFYNNKEYDKAFESFKKACDGVEKNEQKAVELYKKACDGGDMRGCGNLGVMYEKGNGVEKNEQKAVELYKKVCNGGDVRGCTNLG
ncbi:tetratricopeptide repeat protein, partial [Campylobacter sp.]|uniref:tetratricopeptide repeat protein n=1 Tax=Campylobacter sp. TaxID=205 RepID=UPI002AA6AF99